MLQTLIACHLHNRKYSSPYKNIYAYSSPDSAVNSKWKDVGSSTPRSSHVRALACLDQDKQLEIAHVVIYCSVSPLLAGEQGTIHPTWTFRLRSLLVLNLRDSHVEDNVRKRPFTTKI